MLVYEDNGVTIQGSKRFLVDSAKTSNADALFVTHAHSDHARFPKKPKCDVYVSPETREMLGIEEGRDRIFSLEKELKLDDFTVRMHHAGHVFGSKMVHFCNGQDLVVTGDVKLKDDLVVKGATPVECDTLVIESTFGSPEFVFPPREQVYEALEQWCRANLNAGASIMLAGYATGKAQELTAFCDQYLGLEPVVHEQVFRVNEACKAFGAKLGRYLNASTREAREAARSPSIFIMPPSLVNLKTVAIMSHEYERRFVSAFSSGWSLKGGFGRGYTRNFPLSSHADFNELLELVELSGAKKVYTHHGFSRELAGELRKRGFNATPLNGGKQASIGDWNA